MAELTTHVDDVTLIVTRRFNAPKPFVYDAFTVPEQIVKWWGPEGFTTRVTRMDVRPGGQWHYCMSSPEWGDAWGLATYSVIEPPDRLAYEDAFSNEAGTVDTSMPVSSTVIEFAEADGGTLITMRTTYATKEELQKVLEMGVIEGVGSQFLRLDALAAAEA